MREGIQSSTFKVHGPGRAPVAAGASRSFLHALTGAATFTCLLALPLHAEEPASAPARVLQMQRPLPPTSPPRPPVLGDPGAVYQPPGEEGEPEDPYWRETVERAVEQFRTGTAEVRKSAIMLLGKYPVAPAREAVGDAFEDPDAGVRQAALVSVLEEQGQLHPLFADKILSLLVDPDVSIRRIASNSLSAVIHSYPFVMQPGNLQMQRQLPKEAEGIMRKAFRDEDLSVRRNMVANYPFLRIDLPEKTFVALMHDQDLEVSVQTLQWGLPLLSRPVLARELEALVQHENAAFRLELARALQSRRSVETLEALEVLQNDPHPPVALEAMLAIFYHRQSVGLYERIVKLYRENGAPADVGQRVILAAQMLGQQGEPFLREWLDESNPSLRQQAVQIYLGHFDQRAELDLLLALLNDSVQAIRQQAMRALMQPNNRLTPEQVRQILSNRHTDVRRAAAGFASSLPADQAEEILLDLLLDNARDVQVAALQQIGLLQLPGWEEIMSISLRQEDLFTQRTALEWLMRHPTPQTMGLLKEYRDENPRSPLRPQIEVHLRRHQGDRAR